MLLLPIIAIQITLGILFIRYLINHDRGAKEPRAGIRAAVFFGLLAIILGMLFTLPVELLKLTEPLQDLQPVPVPHAALAAILIGLGEEAAKTLPLAIYLWRKPYFNETTDGILYFGIAATVFAVVESSLYALGNGAGVGIMRLFFTPLHVGFAMWFGYFLARRKVTGRGTALVWLGFFAAASLHALYDFGLFTALPILVLVSLGIGIGLVIGVFQLYKFAQKQDAELAIGADGKNNFCRYCGKPNPNHTLFCEVCGQRT